MALFWKNRPRKPLFERSPKSFQEKRRLFDGIAKLLGITVPEEWYKVTGERVAKLGFAKLMDSFGLSIYTALTNVYPEHQWKPWLFQKAPQHFWKERENQREYLDWLAVQLEIQNPLQWYKVTTHALYKRGGRGLLNYYNGSLSTALRTVYPELEWNNLWRISQGQKIIWQLLRAHFDNIILNYRSPRTNMLEIDVYIPSLEIGIEYQGTQHYKQLHIGSFHSQHNRDELKKIACKAQGITLIEIPYWWDLSPSTLLSTIQKHRPEFTFDANEMSEYVKRKVPLKPKPKWQKCKSRNGSYFFG